LAAAKATRWRQDSGQHTLAQWSASYVCAHFHRAGVGLVVELV